MLASFFVATKVANTTEEIQYEEIQYYEIVELIKENKVSEFELNLHSGDLTYKLRGDDKIYRYTVPDAGIFYEDVKDTLSKNYEEHSGTEETIKYNYLRGDENS